MVGTGGSITLALGRTNETGVSYLGTAFAVGSGLFATAAHVVGMSDTNLVAIVPKISSINDYQDTTDTMVKYTPAHIKAFDPLRDIAIIEAGIQMQFSYQVGSTDSAPPGTPVVASGFPHATSGRHVLTVQTSSVGARVLLAAGPLKSRHLILNVQTRPGQSGSPVFLQNQNVLCAMVIGSYVPPSNGSVNMMGVDPATLHQTTHAISAEYIKAMLE